MRSQDSVIEAGRASCQGRAFVIATATALVTDSANQLYFSPISVWDVAIKNALGKPDCRVDPHIFRRAMLTTAISNGPS
jgi:PIN domain nuclease of toxin-antitoxin system